MMRRARPISFLALPVALLAVAVAGCECAQYHLALHYPNDAAWHRAHRGELIVARGARCAILGSGERVASDDVVAQREFATADADVPIGRLSYGKLTFFAQIRDQDCIAFLTGCVEQEIAPHTNVSVTIALVPRTEVGCPTDLICLAGQCGIAVDAGVSDGARPDAAQRDRRLTDTYGVDVVNADRTAPDLAGRDLIGVDSGGRDRAVVDAGADAASWQWAQQCLTVWCDVGGSAGGLSSAQHRSSSAWGGGISAAVGEAGQPSLVLDSTDRPIVAWPSGDVFVRYWDGTLWQEYAGSGAAGRVAGGGTFTGVSLARDAQNRPTVAWSRFDLDRDIFALHWDGAGWSDYGGSSASRGISHTAGISYFPVLALDPAGRPVVAWEDDTLAGRNKNEIYLRYWDGSTWAEYAGSGSGGGVSATPDDSTFPALAIDSLDHPVVAWQETSGGYQHIYLRRWDGSTWTELAGSGSNGGIAAAERYSSSPALVLNDYDEPIVAWENSDAIYVRHWNGSAWAVYAGSDAEGQIAAPATGTSNASLALDNSDQPVVTWVSASDLFLLRWNGNAWVGVDGGPVASHVSTTGGVFFGPAPLAVDSLGHPAVAWTDSTSGYKIFVRHWDGSAWAAYGGSAASGGISNTGKPSAEASVALSPAGGIAVAWQEGAAGYVDPTQVYVKVWDGDSWQGLGGSASGLGISGSVMGSDVYGGGQPSVVYDSAGLPIVAYLNDSSIFPGTGGVGIKRWDGSRWNNFSTYTAAYRAADFSFALDSADRPVVAWEASAVTGGYTEVFVEHWDGTGWVDYAGSGAGGGISNTPDNYSYLGSLALDSTGNPFVSWIEDGYPSNQLYVKGWNGSAWTLYADAGAGGVAVSGTRSHFLAVGASGLPILAWTGSDPADGDAEIYLKRWNGSSWQGLGGSDAGGGISNNLCSSTDPRIVLDQAERPVVAWQDDCDDLRAIYLRRWDGAAWVEWPTGSASGGGVSNTEAPVSLSSFKMVGGVACVAWSEMTNSSSTEIVMRCFGGT